MTVDEQTPSSWGVSSQGPSAIRVIIQQWLTNVMPSVLEGMRQAQKITYEDLPDPVRISPGYEGLWQIDLYPTIAIGVGASRAWQRIGFDSKGTIFEITYPIMVYYWVESHGENAAISVIGKRDAYMMAIRAAMLTKGSLGTRGLAPDGSAYLRVQESTLAETPYDPSNTRAGRYVGAGSTSLSVIAIERTTIAALSVPSRGLEIDLSATITEKLEPFPGEVSES